MYRFFESVIRPLLDAVEPATVVEIGSGDGTGTELLAEWCLKHQALLHSVDPLPKYAVDECLERWPETLRVHRDLSLNALVDIGPADFVCIDGDHNWYTVFHEFELLARGSAGAQRPFPVVVLYNVGWPYGRRDSYADPDTIPDAYRHPHRKAAVVPGKRALADRGFNDHLENAIHEGTPRNGVLTAVEDFLADRAGKLALHLVPGLHGVGIITETDLAGSIAEVLGSLEERRGLVPVTDEVERDRLERLQELWQVREDLHHERERVEHLRDVQVEVEELRVSVEAARQKSIEAKALHKSADERADRAEDRAQRAEDGATRADDRANRAEDWYRQAVVLHDEETQTLKDQLAQLRQQLTEDRLIRQQREKDLRRLRGRRSVRLALSMARLARPIFRIRRGQAKRSKSQRVAPRNNSEGTSIREGPSERSPAAGMNRSDVRAVYSSAGGTLMTLVQQLVEDGVPSRFIQEWNRSEGMGLARTAPLATRPLVSIVMPTYNRANVIGDAIASVLEQTYGEWELLVCDDASDDATEVVVERAQDQRILYHRLPKGGAARARNAGLAEARGDLIAYLDSDNIWHPQFLESTVSALDANRGRFIAYCTFLDVVVRPRRVQLKSFEARPFDYEALSEKNFIDLNSVIHRRVLYDHLGGFDERLIRQQDWELILRYSYLRDPLYVDRFLMMYRRSDKWNQITTVHKQDKSSPVLVRSTIDSTYRNGLPQVFSRDLPSMTVLSWDICRNHFSKAYNLAEAMTGYSRVQLAGFRFFDDAIFPPYADADPQFETLYMPGGEFPEWSHHLAKAVANASGEVLYAVKPRLPSLGVALLANYHFGKPIVLEMNDLESVVTNPGAGDESESIHLADVDPGDPELLNPYSSLWTRIMEGLVPEIPLRVTHNSVLDQHFGGGAYFVRNPKDEKHFDPTNFNRDEVRERLGFAPRDRVLLFGGMVRRHKGVFELAQLVNQPDSPYQLLVVGSRDTPDQAALKKMAGDRVHFVDPVDRNEMAPVNLASDAVVLWLDPDIPASRYQMPFKLTDALAMKVPILANDIGDLGELGRRGYLRLVPFGHLDELKSALGKLFGDTASTRNMVEAGRRLYLRQFSYNAVRRNLEMILTEAGTNGGALPAANEFAEFFSAFQEHLERQTAELAGRH